MLLPRSLAPGLLRDWMLHFLAVVSHSAIIYFAFLYRHRSDGDSLSAMEKARIAQSSVRPASAGYPFHFIMRLSHHNSAH